MFLVQHPDNLIAERQYILDWMLVQRLGVSCRFEAQQRNDTLITSADGRRLIIADGFLGQSEQSWLGATSVPQDEPVLLDCGDVRDAPWPIDPALPMLPLKGQRGKHAIPLSVANNCCKLDVDLLGSAFFFLSRYEEVASPIGDQFDRYPARAAYAGRHGFVDRPILDEYVALLALCLRKLWPDLLFKQHQFRIEVSHDVDHPLKFAFKPAVRQFARVVRESVRARSPTMFGASLACWRAVHNGDLASDPFNTFDRIMTESDRRGLRSAFYFITDRPAGNRDAYYDFDDPIIRNMIRQIAGRGHEVGLHASLESYLDPAQTRHEFERLLAAAEQAGVRQSRWGGRQHYLRLRAPMTFRNWASAGLHYDSTLAFTELAGFRAGTCHEFRPFDLIERRTIPILERPLIAMETTVIENMGMGLSDAALELMIKLKQRCKAQQGVYSLLWHNSNLATPRHWQMYIEVLDA